MKQVEMRWEDEQQWRQDMQLQSIDFVSCNQVFKRQHVHLSLTLRRLLQNVSEMEVYLLACYSKIIV